MASLALPFQWVGSIRFSRTGEFLLATSTTHDHLSTYLKIWRTRNWAEVPAAPVHYSTLVAADLSPDDRVLALARGDGTVQLSEFPSGRPLASFQKREGYLAVRFFAGWSVAGSRPRGWSGRIVERGRPAGIRTPLPGHFLDTGA